MQFCRGTKDWLCCNSCRTIDNRRPYRGLAGIIWRAWSACWKKQRQSCEHYSLNIISFESDICCWTCSNCVKRPRLYCILIGNLNLRQSYFQIRPVIKLYSFKLTGRVHTSIQALPRSVNHIAGKCSHKVQYFSQSLLLPVNNISCTTRYLLIACKDKNRINTMNDL